MRNKGAVPRRRENTASRLATVDCRTELLQDFHKTDVFRKTKRYIYPTNVRLINKKEMSTKSSVDSTLIVGPKKLNSFFMFEVIFFY